MQHEVVYREKNSRSQLLVTDNGSISWFGRSIEYSYLTIQILHFELWLLNGIATSLQL